MAGGQHKLSRRAVLAGACAGVAVPLGRHPGLDPGSTFLQALPKERWMPDQVRHDDQLDVRWERAAAGYARAALGIERVAHTQDDDLYDRVLGRHNAALSRLLRARAPDLRAVAEKLELILRHKVFELSFGEAALEALRRDVRGFAGVGSE
jgi:hypothetical protein